MKLLLWHCEYVAYRDKRRSSRPEKLRQLPREKSSARFNDVVVAFTCVEHGDSISYVNTAKDEIMRNIDMVRCKRNVVVIPFVHLSSRIAQPKIAMKIIGEIIKSLKAAGVTVYEASFGFHKDFSLYFKGYGHPGSVCFRSIPYKKGSES